MRVRSVARTALAVPRRTAALLSTSVCLIALHTGAARSQKQADQLAGNTVLIVRHAEKPADGRELTPAGEARARAYIRYFAPFREDGKAIQVSALYAGADSEGSVRPRLTLEPLSRSTHLPLNTSISTKEGARLVSLLRAQPHGLYPLICWRHGGIPELVRAFGGDPAELLPGAKWPDEVYDWVLVLDFDREGRLTRERRLVEHLPAE